MQNLPLRAYAPAKINLYLGVYPQKDQRGYHRVDSLMCAIGLHDQLDFQPASGFQVCCTPEVDFPMESNSVYKAVLAFCEAFQCQVPNMKVTIHKNIPFKSGLGGASADAAATLLVMAGLFGVDPKNLKLLEIASSLGADVPFFLQSQIQLLKGAGDLPYQSFQIPEGLWLVLVRPFGDGITAQEAYQCYDRHPQVPPSVDSMVEALTSGDVSAVAARLSNSLDPLALELMEPLVKVKRWLASQNGVLSAMVSGSGSSIFAICASQAQAQQVSAAARELGLWSWSGAPVDSGVVMEAED